MVPRSLFAATPILTWAALNLGCNSPMFSTPKHLNVVVQANHPDPGYQIVLMPFENGSVKLSGAMFEFNCLDEHPKDYQIVTKFFRSVQVNSPVRLKLHHPGNYRVNIRSAGFKRVNFDLPMRKEDFISIEVALEYDPNLAWELQPEFPKPSTK
jgi:hypothetical protein